MKTYNAAVVTEWWNLVSLQYTLNVHVLAEFGELGEGDYKEWLD